MYPEYMQESLKLVEKTRPERLKKSLSGEKVFTPMTDVERSEVLTKFHPDYQADARRKISIGPNRDENITSEIADLLESHSRINPDDFDLSRVDYDTDVLVIGCAGGNAGVEKYHQHDGGSA